jgi:hypothetical protein
LCVQRLLSSLFWINSSKVLHVFLQRIWSCLIYSCWDMIVSLCYRITHISIMWVHENKVRGYLCHCVGFFFESYIILWYMQQVVTLPKVIQQSFLQRRGETIKIAVSVLIMDATFVLHGTFKV